MGRAARAHLLRGQGLVQHLYVRVLREVIELTEVRDDPLQVLQQLQGAGGGHRGVTAPSQLDRCARERSAQTPKWRPTL